MGKSFRRSRWLQLPLRAGVSALALALLACAGGGGSSQPSVPNPPVNPPPPPPSGPSAAEFRTAEYQRSWALEAIHSAEAYAQGPTGNGVTVGFVDFNFQLSSSEVRYNLASRGPNAQAVAWYTARIGEAPDTDTHGHMVASIAAGVKNNNGIHGVAFNAGVLAVDYFSNVNPDTFLYQGVTYHVSDPWTYLTSRGVRVIGESFGYDDEDFIPDPPPGMPRPTDAYVLELPVAAIANGALLVASAGNNFGRGASGGADPIRSNLDTLEDIAAEGLTNGPGAYIIVGAVDENKQMASFSNRAGIARNNFMVAPGVDIVAPFNGELYYVGGTSVSAPLVVGAAALVMERWPTLTARQVADILFASATDLGAPGVDAIFGHGLLNVAAALQPLGVTSFAAPGVTGAVTSSAIVLGPAFGDAPALRAALNGVAIFDGFGRDFRFDASKLTLARPANINILGVVKQEMGWHVTEVPLEFGRVAFSFHDDSVFAFHDDNGLETARAPQAQVRLSGSTEAFSWSAGNGVHVSDAVDGAGRFGFAPLTRAFAPALDAAPDVFAALQFTVNDGDTLSVALSEGGDHNDFRPIAAQAARRNMRMAALRYDHTLEAARVNVEIGSAWEEGALLGTLSSGGLGLAEKSQTLWTSIAAEASLAPMWSIKATATLARSSADLPAQSLFADVAPIMASQFSLGVARANLISEGDVWTIAVTQRLRVESGDVRFLSGAGTEHESASLVPSGREKAFETSYRMGFGAWSASVAMAHRFDAGHIAGKQETSALLSVQRAF